MLRVTNNQGKDRIINEKGEVAVVISPEYGSGWSTWNNDRPVDPMDADVVELVLKYLDTNQSFSQAQLEDKLRSIFGKLYTIPSSWSIEWVEVGKEFYIREYDGAEFVVTKESFNWYTAE